MGFVRFHFMNSNSQFESIPRTSNSRGSLQSSQQYASKYQFEPLVHYSSSKESLQSLQLNSLKCKFETVAKHMNPRGFLQRAQPYGSKSQFENGRRAPQFEPANKNSNSRGFLQSAQPYGSKFQFENGASAPQFEPFEKISKDNPEKGEVEAEIDKFETANENVETKNKKRGRPKAKNKTSPPTIQKLSNHIKFIDYIPTHELITYRHLFAYGFYIV